MKIEYGAEGLLIIFHDPHYPRLPDLSRDGGHLSNLASHITMGKIKALSWMSKRPSSCAQEALFCYGDGGSSIRRYDKKGGPPHCWGQEGRKKLLKGGKFLRLMKLPKNDMLKEHIQPTQNTVRTAISYLRPSKMFSLNLLKWKPNFIEKFMILKIPLSLSTSIW